jgi:hypothetical protein
MSRPDNPVGPQRSEDLRGMCRAVFVVPAELKHDATRIPDIILMTAEAFGAVDLSHHILHLNRLDRNTFG